MSARFGGRLALWLVAFVACEPREQAPEQLRELPFALEEELGARRGEWSLEGPSEAVRFLVGDLDREPSAARYAESVPLRDGGVLAAVMLAQEYESQTCYLELQPSPEGWCPVRVGAFDFSDTGGSWFEGLHGRVLVDARRNDAIDCRVELVSSAGSYASFRLDFLVDPSRDSVHLRDWIGSVPGGPTLR